MLCATSPLGEWLASQGGSFHPSLEFRQDAFGGSVYAAEPLGAGEAAVTCPFSLAITPASARRCLAPLLATADATDHHLLTLYLVLHLLPTADIPEGVQLDSKPYVDSLPKAEEMMTPCWFNSDEMKLLEGTNLLGATQDRLEGWRREWQEVQALAGAVGDRIAWEHFLWACTILSSRAFPSTLIDSSAESTPILFPGVDTLNHRLGAKATWFTDVNMPNIGTVKGGLSIVLDEGVETDQQAFNTYGAKPNEELLLGYGFTAPSNPSDIVALKLSLPPQSSWALEDLPAHLETLGLTDLRHFVPRSGVIPEQLLAQMRLFMAQDEELHGYLEMKDVNGGEGQWAKLLKFLGWENELDVLDALEGMLQAKLAGLRRSEQLASSADSSKIRPGVAENVAEYRRGQMEVLEAALAWRMELFEEVSMKAQREGVYYGMEDVEEEEEAENQ